MKANSFQFEPGDYILHITCNCGNGDVISFSLSLSISSVDFHCQQLAEKIQIVKSGPNEVLPVVVVAVVVVVVDAAEIAKK